MGERQPLARPQREDYERALESMETFMDVGVNDLMTLAERAEHFADQRVRESLGVTEVMSRPVRTVSPETPMAEAAHLMVSARISGLPVVDEAGRLAGIVTEADFLRALGVPGHHPAHTLWQTLESLYDHLARHAELEAPDDPVAQHMVRDVVCVAPDQSVHDALERMRRHRVKRVVVCDGDRRPVGMLTRSDLVRLFFDRWTGSP